MTARRVGAAYLLMLAALTLVLVLVTDGDERHGRRCEAPGAVILAGRDVPATDLTQRKLRCADLERATVDGVISETDLRGANLHATNLKNAEMSDVDLSRADLTDGSA